MNYEQIFAVHFPGHPILPGVCIMQMVVEHAERTMGCQLVPTAAKDVKFLVPVTPDVLDNIQCDISATDEGKGMVTLRAKVKDAATTYAKMTLKCKK